MLTIKKNGKRVWVTFVVASDESIDDVSLCGAWNDWKEEPMKQKKNGDFSLTRILKADNTFEFGYKINGERWVTERECSSVDSPFASKNSLLEL